LHFSFCLAKFAPESTISFYSKILLSRQGKRSTDPKLKHLKYWPMAQMKKIR
jgi:hypothetical protein